MFLDAIGLIKTLPCLAELSKNHRGWQAYPDKVYITQLKDTEDE